MPVVNAERIIEGARNLSPSLGERMLAGRINGKSVFVRALRLEDLKLEVDELKEKEALSLARYFGAIVGKAHARQMSEETAHAWHQDLTRSSSTKGAPNWLWKCVVELAAMHEAAYLDHCRRYVDTKLQ